MSIPLPHHILELQSSYYKDAVAELDRLAEKEAEIIASYPEIHKLVTSNSNTRKNLLKWLYR